MTAVLSNIATKEDGYDATSSTNQQSQISINNPEIMSESEFRRMSQVDRKSQIILKVLEEESGSLDPMDFPSSYMENENGFPIVRQAVKMLKVDGVN